MHKRFGFNFGIFLVSKGFVRTKLPNHIFQHEYEVDAEDGQKNYFCITIHANKLITSAKSGLKDLYNLDAPQPKTKEEAEQFLTDFLSYEKTPSN